MIVTLHVFTCCSTQFLISDTIVDRMVGSRAFHKTITECSEPRCWLKIEHATTRVAASIGGVLHAAADGMRVVIVDVS